jgi:hypothetical protein
MPVYRELLNLYSSDDEPCCMRANLKKKLRILGGCMPDGNSGSCIFSTKYYIKFYMTVLLV